MDSFIGSDVDCDSGFLTRRSVQINPDEAPIDQHGGLNPRYLLLMLLKVKGTIKLIFFFFISNLLHATSSFVFLENVQVEKANRIEKFKNVPTEDIFSC